MVDCVESSRPRARQESATPVWFRLFATDQQLRSKCARHLDGLGRLYCSHGAQAQSACSSPARCLPSGKCSLCGKIPRKLLALADA